MWEATLLVTNCLTGIIILGILLYSIVYAIRLKRAAGYYVGLLSAVIMNCDELLDELLNVDQSGMTVKPEVSSPVPQQSDAPEEKRQAQRERLAALVAGGQAKQYLGRAITVDQVEAMDDEEIVRLYARYEAGLGAAMTKTLGQAALQLYTRAASMFLPIPSENQPRLVEDLEADPFMGHALSGAMCELYHRYGMYLAPLTMVLTTAKYCQFRDACPQTDKQSEDGGGESDIRATEGAVGSADKGS
jgi:hypothetical protein